VIRRRLRTRISRAVRPHRSQPTRCPRKRVNYVLVGESGLDWLASAGHPSQRASALSGLTWKVLEQVLLPASVPSRAASRAARSTGTLADSYRL
jgi:hypothetical protein